MPEILFTLTTIYVAYVVYCVSNSQKLSGIRKPPENTQINATVTETSNAAPATVTAGPTTTAAASIATTAPGENPVITSETPTPKAPPPPAKKPTATTKRTRVSATPASRGSLRDPKTGEVAVLGGNYRFTKRWIKEALVAEGLLDRIYKNNQLDEEAEVAIKTAMGALAEMEKYRA